MNSNAFAIIGGSLPTFLALAQECIFLASANGFMRSEDGVHVRQGKNRCLAMPTISLD